MHTCVTIGAAETIKKTQMTTKGKYIQYILNNNDIVAGEANYHYSCYKMFTKQIPATNELTEEEINSEENKAIVKQKLMEYIIIEKKDVTMTNVYEIYS